MRDDVFIVTRSQLTPQDPDSAYNLFDARVGGVQLVTPPQCQGTGCQGLPSRAADLCDSAESDL